MGAVGLGKRSVRARGAGGGGFGVRAWGRARSLVGFRAERLWCVLAPLSGGPAEGGLMPVVRPAPVPAAPPRQDQHGSRLRERSPSRLREPPRTQSRAQSRSRARVRGPVRVR